MIYSNAIVNENLDTIVDVISDYENRHKWDANFSDGGLLKSVDKDSQLHYIKTVRQAVISCRDQNLLINRKIIEAKDSQTGNKIFILGARSQDLEQFPEKKGIVRASCYITGYYIEQISPDQCHVHFIIETDYKIPQRLHQAFGVNGANYAYEIKKYVEKEKKKRASSKA